MSVDWSSLFGLSMAPLELIVRGSVVYWFLFLIFRFVLKRDVGAVGIAEILLPVIVADAAQNAMGGQYRTVTDGFILISTIIGWNIAFDFLAYRFPTLRRLLQPRPLCLVRHGTVFRRNMRRELISDDELESKLREHGVASLSEVEAAYMESDGGISVIKREGDEPDKVKRVGVM